MTKNAGRVAPTLLLHVNLLLMLFAGAMLSAAARLKWDPTAYIAARELFPLEYRWAAAALPVAGAALALLAHLALAALRCRRASPRRVLLIVYAATMLVVAWGEAVWSGWLAWRVRRWLRGGDAAELRHALALGDHLHPLLQHLAHYHPLPEKLNQIMAEAEADLPRNLYVAASASCVLLALQLSAAALALWAARAVRPRPRPRARARPRADSDVTITTPLSSRKGHSDKTPLKAVYRNGRLVIE